MTVIQGDIVGVTADAVIHPTNGQFSLTGEVGRLKYHCCRKIKKS